MENNTGFADRNPLCYMAISIHGYGTCIEAIDIGE